MRTEVLILDHEPEIYAEALGPLFPEVTFHTATEPEAALPLGREAEVLVALAHAVSAEQLAAMPRLRWVAALSTGVDHLLAQPGLRPEVVVTNGRGIHGPQMSEMAFLYMISLLRDFPAMLANQRAHRWQRWPQRLLLNKTVVLLGIGAISEELARRCQAFGMRVLGVSDARTEAPGFDAVLPRARLEEAAAQADVLVALVPLTESTRHMVSRAVIAAMKPGAILLNLARGPVVDEAALIEALQEGRLGGAGLDVFEVEPLPDASPLWDMPNVIVTPRVGGMSDVYAHQALPLMEENLRLFLAGDMARLRNLVQRQGERG
ncbi:D-2-hydroxyacid dehydrogenase [Roseomonas sp. BN140053]|uniref:D-2-hydroxyacid dehydrogenase n=1 Tax=Roseomonas sp. BN140053 TaxID=3391898 RepID=UPI0039EA0E24